MKMDQQKVKNPGTGKSLHDLVLDALDESHLGRTDFEGASAYEISRRIHRIDHRFSDFDIENALEELEKTDIVKKITQSPIFFKEMGGKRMSENNKVTCKSEVTHEQEISLTHEVMSKETLDTLLKNTASKERNNDSDLESVSHDYLRSEVLKLRNAIREHRDQKGDDRCWMDDVELYKVLPEGVANVDLSLLSDEQFKRNCDLFIKNRKCPVPQGAVIGQYVMDRLRERIGQVLIIITSELCSSVVQIGKLKNIENFDYVILHHSWLHGLIFPDRVKISFLDSWYAVRKIISFEGDILYENLVIPKIYGKQYSDPFSESTQRFPRSDEDVKELTVLSFGKEVAEKLS